MYRIKPVFHNQENGDSRQSACTLRGVLEIVSGFKNEVGTEVVCSFSVLSNQGQGLFM